jgi:hypothetical protein
MLSIIVTKTFDLIIIYFWDRNSKFSEKLKCKIEYKSSKLSEKLECKAKHKKQQDKTKKIYFFELNHAWRYIQSFTICIFNILFSIFDLYLTYNFV